MQNLKRYLLDMITRKFGKHFMTFVRYNHRVVDLIDDKIACGQKVQIRGWVRHIRSLKDRTFLAVNDGSCLQNLQIVIPSGCLDYPEPATYGTSVRVSGMVQESTGQGQAIDVMADSVQVVGQCDQQEYPLKVKKRHPPEYTRQFLHLRPKTTSFGSLLRVRNGLTQALHQTLQAQGYISVDCPVITSNDCEGGGDVFLVEPANPSLLSELDSIEGDEERGEHFFGVPAYLTVSTQLHLEAAAAGIDRVYTLGPTFRAENSRGRHHLSEFYMLEAEIAFLDSLAHLTEVVEEVVRATVAQTLDVVGEDLRWQWKNSGRDPAKQEEMYNKLLAGPYVRMTYTEAMEVLQQNRKQFTFNPQWGSDLQKEHEHFIVKHCGDSPVFVTDFPASYKAFYMKMNPSSSSNIGKTVAGLDLLVPGVAEVCGGSLRETDLSVLRDRKREAKVHANLDWYLDLRRFGSVPHGGFGIGVDRLLMAMTGIQNIRDAIPFPRSPNHCKL